MRKNRTENKQKIIKCETNKVNDDISSEICSFYNDIDHFVYFFSLNMTAFLSISQSTLYI